MSKSMLKFDRDRFRSKSRSAVRVKRDPSGQMDRSISSMHIKRVDLGEDGKFSGYLSVFNNIDFYGEVIAPGAWTESIAAWKASGQPMPLLWQHDSWEPIGVWTDLKEDKYGLRADGQILIKAGALEQRAWAHIQAGSMAGLSVGFYLEEWQEDSEGGFTITKADLREGSVVTFPANREALIDETKQATLAVRRKLAHQEPLTVREMEFMLREQVGLSRRAAATVIEGGYKDWHRRETGIEDDTDRGWNEPVRISL